MVELPVGVAAELRAAPRGGEGVVLATTVALELHVVVDVAGENGVRSVGEQPLDLPPVGGVGVAGGLVTLGIGPQGLVQEDQGVAWVGVLLKIAADECYLVFADELVSGVLAAETKEVNSLVVERVPLGAEPLVPELVHQGIGDVVISGDEKELHFHLVNEAQELLPLRLDFFPILGVALDKVADRKHELGTEHVELAHGVHPNAGAVPTIAVGHDGDLEAARVVEQRLVGPGFGAIDLGQVDRSCLLFGGVVRVSKGREGREREKDE